MTVRTIDGCIKCGACMRECPVLRTEGRESFPGPRRLVIEGPRFNRELEALGGPLMLCTTCGRCRSVCPSSLPLPEALVRVRAMVPPGPLPEGQRRMAENIDRCGRTVRPEGRATDRPERGDLLFFPGCISEGRLPETVSSSLALLRASGASPYVPKGWSCCGSPLEKIGDEGRYREVRECNSRLFEGIDTAVTTCPGCTVQLCRSYGKEAWHILEYLHRCGGLFPRSFDPAAPRLRVALHRPCHLARVVGPHTMDMARELLSLVPGIDLVGHEGEDECCGGGGGVASARPEVAARMAGTKVDAARRAGADILLAPCPFCVVNLRKAGGLAVEELTSFLAGRLARRQKP